MSSPEIKEPEHNHNTTEKYTYLNDPQEERQEERKLNTKKDAQEKVTPPSSLSANK
jgi:hypothetical protein